MAADKCIQSQDPKSIDISDKPVFDEAYKAIKLPLADLSFSMMMVWNPFLNIRWTRINGNLCVFADFEKSCHLWGPPLGGTRAEETIALAFEYIERYNKEEGLGGTPMLYYIPEELKMGFGDLKSFSMQHQGQDYIYNTDELSNLPGKDFAEKRNLKHSFEQSYAPSIEEYDAKRYKEGCLELLSRWMQMKGESVQRNIHYKFKAEALTAKTTIILAEKLGLKGIVVLVDGRIEGFTFGEAMNPGIANVMVEKTNLRIKGIPQYIFSEFVKRCFSGIKYINAGEDWEVDYLKRTKLSYHPAFLLKSYCLRRKSPD